VPVLAKGKTTTGRLWSYVRDDRPFGGDARASALFNYSPNRTAAHPLRHLAGWQGILQADAYAGFNGLYDAACLPSPGGVFGRSAQKPATLRSPLVALAFRVANDNLRAI